MKNIHKNKIKSAFLNYFLVILFGVFSLGSAALAKEITAENVIEIVNESRMQNNLPRLLTNPILNKVATDKARHMVTYHYFSHYSPDGIDPWYWFDQENYDYKYAGENLAINYKTAESQQTAWMKSATHRKNILSPNYTETGVATATGYIDDKPAFITVQVFGTPQKNIVTDAYPQQERMSTKGKTVLSPYVLGKEFQPALPTQYLSAQEYVNEKVSANNIKISFNKNFIVPIKRQSQNIIWTVILILSIVVIRDMVLNSIHTPSSHRPSMTNLIILVMLWSVFISL